MIDTLSRRLDSLRRRIRIVALMRGLGFTTSVLLGGGLLLAWIDWQVHLPAIIRAALLLLLLAGTLFVAIQFWIRPLRQRLDDLTLALMIEEQFPGLNDALASTVQFLEKQGDSADSKAMREEAIRRALQLTEDCEFDDVVDTRGLGTAGIAATLLVAGAVYLFAAFPQVGLAGALRLLFPFGQHHWPTATQLELTFRKRIPIGKPFEIRGKVTGVVPDHVTFEFKGLYASEVARRYPVEKKSDEATGGFLVKLDMTHQTSDFYFRVVANDARLPRREGSWYRVEVAEPPYLVADNGKPPPYVRLHLPEYMGLPSPQDLPAGVWEIIAPEGASVDLRAMCNRRVAAAWLQHVPVQDVQLRGEDGSIATGLAVSGSALGAELSAIGMTHPLLILSTRRGIAQAYARIPASVDDSGTRLWFRFRPYLSGNYILHLEDDDGLDREYRLRIDLEPDPSPRVDLIEPAGSLSLLPDAVVPIKVSADDARYAVRRMWVRYVRKHDQGQLLDERPGRLSLYDHNEDAELLAESVLVLTGVRIEPPRLRLRFVSRETTLPLKGLVKPGQRLVLQGCADDFNDIVAFNVPGCSHEVEIRIVDKAELTNLLDRKQADLHKKLRQLQKWQNEATKKVVRMEQHLKGGKKLAAEDRKTLEEAAALEEDIKRAIGTTPEQGMRKTLRDIERSLKLNQMESSSTKRRSSIIRKGLDRIRRDMLPEVMERIARVRKTLRDLEGADTKDGKDPVSERSKESEKRKKAAADLSRVRKRQEQVEQTIDNVLRQLERWAKYQEIRDDARDVLREQEELKIETEKLAEDYQPNNEQWKADVERLAELQRQLGDKTDRLVKRMERIAEAKKEKDPSMAKRLRDAVEIAKEGRLADEIRDTAEQLRRALPESTPKASSEQRKRQTLRASRQQQASIERLKEMLLALQEDRSEDLERLARQQDAAAEKLDDLVERLEKLHDETRKASKLEDPEQRKAALEKLAAEQANLEEQLRDQARELNRLDAQDAAEQLNQAADRLEKALKRLEDEQAPEKEQQEALKKLEEARKALRQAQKKTQDELERERLARLADHLEGLKERQGRLIEEADRIHRKVMQKGWDQFGLNASVLGLRDGQELLGGETDQLAQKYEQVKVFALVLRKASQDMKRAAKQIEVRWHKSLTRLVFPFPDEVRADEERLHAGINRAQKHAYDRLQRLFDALKQELKKRKEQQQGKNQQQPNGKEGGQPQQAGIQPQDFIPPVAQLKVFLDEQKDILDRTARLEKQRQANGGLPPEDAEELERLHEDQEALLLLFQEIVQAANAQQGKQP